MRRTAYKIDEESGSPFMTVWAPNAPYGSMPFADDGIFTERLDEVRLESLVLRPTVILDVPGTERYEITGEDIQRAVEKADYREGDDVLVRTGWGSKSRAFEMGPSYVLDGPGWSYDACVEMSEAMRAHKSAILMTHAPLIMTARYQGWSWSAGAEQLVPRPKPWPSIEASERLLDSPEPGPNQVRRPTLPPEAGKGGYKELLNSTLAICKCLVEASEIRANRVRMIILPLVVRNGGAAPCRFIAVEE
ncbi:cyclase family protein [Amycolatopsis panacis]|uniref:Cyclase family protein n=1 Tax=Amycolatopsis panacis TaxID=2340917 RepID=A0A419I3D1_9PSEU|nr:cyclase family protein [Amycolatopsis panacis]RJQ84677.1 hypothetical protein D5S19_16300 [Amycolatopsis panacis]